MAIQFLNSVIKADTTGHSGIPLQILAPGMLWQHDFKSSLGFKARSYHKQKAKTSTGN